MKRVGEKETDAPLLGGTPGWKEGEFNTSAKHFFD